MDAAASLAEQRRLAFSTLTKHASKVARGTRGTREEQEDDIELSGDEEEPTEPGPPRRMSPSEIATMRRRIRRRCGNIYQCSQSCYQ